MERDEIEQWVRERVAFYLEVPTERVDPHESLAAQGFDSVFALAVCGDVEDKFGLEVEPTLAWDYPTVSAIATQLDTLMAAQETAAK